ncbi:hypothetical protein DPEC_G00352050 [Dallia pectoralis]|uniref:Uncharacterized protein n=1 Tax=Dallia pectoralis TaxID=75939 RepID=A0ACC2F261_DALPE|nr:hypothetical protein DPEC_G00352050 [Dallia pectoralis]
MSRVDLRENRLSTAHSVATNARYQVSLTLGEMGCGLRKLKPSEEASPGKIYSTLKRPQVETKVGVAYTYQYVDFLVGKDDGSSTLCLLSVRELPGQLQDLYQQGFSLVAVHPFIHPCGSDTISLQQRLYRAVLIRLNDGSEKSPSTCALYRLQLEQCLSADQTPTPELIQGYVKKQIQDAADQGLMFVGFIQGPCAVRGTQTRVPETPSFSLHSSPSSVLGSLSSGGPATPRTHGEPGTPEQATDQGTLCNDGDTEAKEAAVNTGGSDIKVGENSGDGGSSVAVTPSTDGQRDRSQELKEEDTQTQNNNRTNVLELREKANRCHNGVELLALFNEPTDREGPLKYYTVKVPLRVQLCDQGVKGVEANWLDHMTQHFNNGASLVDGYFHLGNDNDLLPKSVESVFVFQEEMEGGDENVTPPTMYDAIVVEQWTTIDGLQVKTDYVPLLQSLAVYGWRLTCVLPTPIIKTNSDGSMATKQVIFLQRPVLPRKRRESKKLIFKIQKSNKNCVKDVPKNKKKKNTPSTAEILDDGETAVKEESRNMKKNKGNKMPKVAETSVETVCKQVEAPGTVEEEKNDEMSETEGVSGSAVGTGEEKDGAAGTDDGTVKEAKVDEGGEAVAEMEPDRDDETDDVRGNDMTVVDETESTEEVDVKRPEEEKITQNGIETDEGANKETDNVSSQLDPTDREEQAAQDQATATITAT